LASQLPEGAALEVRSEADMRRSFLARLHDAAARPARGAGPES